MAQSKGGTVAAAIFAVIATAAGLGALAMGLIQGRRAGWENMMIYGSPAIVAAFIAIAIRRNVPSYIGLAGAALAIVGMVLGR